MTRVAYIGNFGPEWSTENDVRLAFESIGCEVHPLQENSLDYGNTLEVALSSDLLLWTSTWDDALSQEHSRDLLYRCAREGVVTATYHLDTFWTTHRGGRKWWRNPMFATAHVFTADGDHQAKWRRLGVNHEWLRPGVRHSAVFDGTARDEFVCDVAFVGSDAAPRGKGYHPEWTYRFDLVHELHEMCVRNGWSFKNPGGREPKVDRGDMNDFYASAKVTVGDSLCFEREQARYWSDRAYEAPGRGGVLVMPQIDALADDYDGALPMYPWGDWAALEEIVGGLVGDPSERDRVRTSTQAHVRGKHTYAHRMADLLARVGLR